MTSNQCISVNNAIGFCPNVFPFSNVNDNGLNELFCAPDSETFDINQICSNLNKIDEETCHDNFLNLGDDIDPDSNFYSVLNINKSLYFTENELIARHC